MGNIPLWDYARFTDTGSSHHNAFWNAVDQSLPADLRKRLNEGGDLRALWEARKTEAAPRPQFSSILLPVPYEYQLDSGPSGYRECFSSSCAMVTRFWKPGAISSDQEYNAVRARYGDTTDVNAQLSALRALGLKATFRQDGKAETLDRLLRAGQPVPVGWLHRGPVQQPSGSGHWSVVIGADPQAFVHHDPNGEAALVEGGYVDRGPKAGQAVRYSRKNWLPRWLVDGAGWYLDVRP